MKLTTVLASVDLNSNYYLFIPKQILFWKKFNIKFIALIVGNKIPDELLKYSYNIILWNRNLDLNSVFVSQHLRMYYTSLLNIPDDELVMITDMDMLPMNDRYYKYGLDKFSNNDFIYYRSIDRNQIYICYNAAHPKIWSKIFNINNENDIEERIKITYSNNYNGIPGSTGWFCDQEILYKYLIKYPYLKVLNRPIKRLEVEDHIKHIKLNHKNFIYNYDDAHYHRSFIKNINLINNAEQQLLNK